VVYFEQDRIAGHQIKAANQYIVMFSAFLQQVSMMLIFVYLGNVCECKESKLTLFRLAFSIV
jgi:hypothetical protein